MMQMIRQRAWLRGAWFVLMAAMTPVFLGCTPEQAQSTQTAAAGAAPDAAQTLATFVHDFFLQALAAYLT